MYICEECVVDIKQFGEFCFSCFAATIAVDTHKIPNIYTRGVEADTIMKFLENRRYVITREIDDLTIQALPNYTSGKFDPSRQCYCWNRTHIENDPFLEYREIGH